MGGVLSAPFVDRVAELGVLEACLREAREGHPQFVLIGAEAGMGKSRLVQEVVSRGRELGFVPAVGASVPIAGPGLPFGPVVEALRRLAAHVGEAVIRAHAGGGRHEIARLLPELRPTSLDKPRGHDDPLSDTRLLDAVAGLVTSLATRHPILLAFEDLHWADASTRTLVALLTRTLESARVVLVGTYRTDDLDPSHPLHELLAYLARDRRVVHLELAPLTTKDVAELLAGLVPDAADRRAFVDLTARAAGNPFFVEELVLAARAGGRVRAEFEHSLFHRVESLSAPARRVVDVASVVGRDVDEQLLGAAARLDELALAQALRELQAAHVLVPSGVDRYFFRHVLLREAAYERIGASDRRRLHAGVAKHLSASSRQGGREPVTSSEIAHHWQLAQRLPEALAALVNAGAEAEATYSWSVAHAAYDRALELWPRVEVQLRPESLDLTTLANRAAEAAYRAGDYARAVEINRVALDDPDVLDPTRRATLLADRWRYLTWSNDVSAATATIEEAVGLVDDAAAPVRPRVLAYYAMHLCNVRQYEEVERPASEALKVAIRVGSRLDEIHALSALAEAVAMRGDPDGGLQLVERARAAAIDAGSTLDVVRSYIDEAVILLAANRPSEALAATRQGRASAAGARAELSAGRVLAVIEAEALVGLRRWAEAEAACRGLIEDHPQGWFTTVAHVFLAVIHLARGSRAECEVALAAVVSTTALRQSEYVALFYWAKAELTRRRRSWQRALGIFDEGLVALDGSFDHGGIARLLAGATVAEAGRIREARIRGDRRRFDDLESRVAHLRSFAADCERHPCVFTPVVSAYRVFGEAEYATATGDRAPASWSKAVKAAASVGWDDWKAHALFRWSQELVRIGPTGERARRLLEKAATIANRDDLAELQRQILDLARASGIRLREPPRRPLAGPAAASGAPYALTRREREVLSHVVDGRSDQQIADALYISPKTASVHVTNIKSKLKVETRVEAAMVAIREGLVAILWFPILMSEGVRHIPS